MPRLFKCVTCGGQGQLCKASGFSFDDCGCDGNDGVVECTDCAGKGHRTIGGTHTIVNR